MGACARRKTSQSVHGRNTRERNATVLLRLVHSVNRFYRLARAVHRPPSSPAPSMPFVNVRPAQTTLPPPTGWPPPRRRASDEPRGAPATAERSLRCIRPARPNSDTRTRTVAERRRTPHAPVRAPRAHPKHRLNRHTHKSTGTLAILATRSRDSGAIFVLRRVHMYGCCFRRRYEVVSEVRTPLSWARGRTVSNEVSELKK